MTPIYSILEYVEKFRILQLILQLLKQESYIYTSNNYYAFVKKKIMQFAYIIIYLVWSSRDCVCVPFQNQVLQGCAFWKRHRTIWINVGGLTAGAYLLQRTRVAYSASERGGGKEREREGEGDSI